MPRLSVNLLPPLIALGLTAMLPPVLGLMAPQAKKTAEDKTKIRIVQWASDAKLSRKLSDAEIAKLQKEKTDPDAAVPTYKALAKVAKGQVLQVPDLLETGKKEVAIQGGELAYTKILPGSRLKYVTVNPTSFVRAKPAELHVQVEKGKAQFRVGTLAQPSTIKVSGPMLATAAKGTAFSVGVGEETTSVLVAEGKVDVFLDSASGDTKTINAGEKYVFRTADGFDFQDQATAPLNDQDRDEIRQLLSLPTQALYGYENREPRRPDAETIVVTKSERIANFVDGEDSGGGFYFTYKPAWLPNSLNVTGRQNFWTVDGNGRRSNVGKGFFFESLSPDGQTIFASKLNDGLWKMNWNGSGKVRLTTKPICSVIGVSPDGKRIVASTGWERTPILTYDSKKKIFKDSGKKEWVPARNEWILLDVPSKKVVTILTKEIFRKQTGIALEDATERIEFARGGRFAFFSISNLNAIKWIGFHIDGLKVTSIGVRNANIFPWKLSPLGRWIYGPLNNKKWEFISSNPRNSYTHQNEQDINKLELLLGEQEIAIDGKVLKIESDGSERRDRTSKDLAYPECYELDVHPNGELMIWQDILGVMARKGIPIVLSDTLNTDRSTVTAHPSYSATYGLDWVSNREVIMRSYRKRFRITFGVKKPTIPQP